MSAHVDSQCAAFQAAIGILSRPWSGVILNSLQGGPLRFGELGDRIPGLGDKMLSSRLKELEKQGLLTRDVAAGPPVRVSYDLTERGRSFNRVARAIECWGRELIAESQTG